MYDDRFALPPHIVVVGGGIAGLAAALRLRDAGPEGTAVTVLEQSGSVGGKLRTGWVAGVPIEDGAESFLFRAPEAKALAARVGLGDELVSPSASGAAIYVDGSLRPMPSGTMMGIPADLEAIAESGLLSDATMAKVRAESGRAGIPLHGSDVAVGPLIAERLGTEVLDRLVEPLLGGVYAGRADNLSLRATMPVLAAGLADQPSLVRAARASRGTPGTGSPGASGTAAPSATPMFATVRGGLSRLVTAVAHESRAAIRTGVAVRRLQPDARGWRLTIGPTNGATTIRADAVVLAVPARPAARLLLGVEDSAAEAIGRLEYASVALVSLVLPGRLALPPGTGALVPASAGRLVKAVTYVSQKWGHVLDGVAGDVTVLRASVGRHGEETALHLSDAELTAAVLDELRSLVPLRGAWPTPLGVRVNRWGGALPQYAPGHLDRIEAARGALAGHPSLALAGAAYDGVGIPACIRSGQTAAEQVLAALADGAHGTVHTPGLTEGAPIHG